MSLRPTYPLLTLLALLSCVACAELTEPASGAPAKATATNAPAIAPSPAPAAPKAAPDTSRVTASHILIAYKGAQRSKATRTKEEARKLAGEIVAKAKAGQDFAALSSQFSDDTGAKARGGSLGAFSKEQMVKPFSDAAFALRPGQVSGIVETEFGFHVIKRTE